MRSSFQFKLKGVHLVVKDMPATRRIKVSGVGHDRSERVIRLPRAFADGMGIFAGDFVTAYYGDLLVVVPEGVDARRVLHAMRGSA